MRMVHSRGQVTVTLPTDSNGPSAIDSDDCMLVTSDVEGRSFVYRDIDCNKPESTMTEFTRMIRHHRGRLPRKKFQGECRRCRVINLRAASE